MNSPSFSKNTIIYLVGGVVAAGGNIILAPMYLRLLSAEDYGAWSKFSLMLQFLQPIMSWGLLATMARLIVGSDAAARRQKIAAALKMVTVLNVALLLIIVGVTQQRTLLLPITDQILQLLPFAALAAALAAYPSILMGMYVADSKALQYRSLSLVGFSLQMVVLAACASQFLVDAKMAILAMISAASIFAALSAYQLARAAKWNVGASEYKALLMFGGPVVLYTIAGQSSEFVTRYVLAATVTSNEFGAFSAGMIYASVIAMLSSAINLAWVPLFYRRAQEWMASDVYNQFVNVFSAFTGLIAAFLIVFSGELLDVYSGGKVVLNESIVGALVISCWLSSAIWMSLSNPLFHRKRSKLVLVIVLMSIVISMPLALFLINRHGAFGASLALLFNALVLCLIAALTLSKLGIPGLNYSKIFIIFFFLILISSPIMNFIYNESSTLLRIAEKAVLLAAFVGATAIRSFRSGQKVLRIIESGGKQ